MIDKGLTERFNAKWREDASGCWIWTGALAGKGYGEIKATGSRRYLYAHRVSWEMVNGPIPIGLMVLHRCDKPGCVNPAHLFVGTSGDNLQDMKAKRRHLFGERNAQAVLTEKNVLRIYARRDQGWTHDRISAEAGVSRITVQRVLKGTRWPHLYERERRGK